MPLAASRAARSSSWFRTMEAGRSVGVSAGEHLPKETWEAVYDASGLRLVNGIGAMNIESSVSVSVRSTCWL